MKTSKIIFKAKNINIWIFYYFFYDVDRSNFILKYNYVLSGYSVNFARATSTQNPVN